MDTRTKAKHFPCRNLRFPSCSHTRELIFSASRDVKEKATMIVARILAYERRKRVARTGTELLLLSLATSVKYLLRRMLPATHPGLQLCPPPSYHSVFNCERKDKILFPSPHTYMYLMPLPNIAPDPAHKKKLKHAHIEDLVSEPTVMI